jgi:hypothetical protein
MCLGNTQLMPVVTIYQTGKLFRNAYKHTATGGTAANGFQVTGLFPCDKNIFRRCDFPLTSEDTHAVPVNHPALVNTSNQPSSNSANFSPFTSAASLIIRYQLCAKPEPKAKSLW